MIKYFLWIIVFISAGVGTFLITKSFHISTNIHKRSYRLIFIGWTGVILLFISGIIIIYFYSLQPTSQRTMKEIYELKKNTEELPDISMK